MIEGLIDGDIVLYRCGFVTQEETEEYAIKTVDEAIRNLLDEAKCSKYRIFLSCPRPDNFRTKLFPDYKANRKQDKPIHFEAMKNYLLDVWKAEVAVEEEADDMIGKNLNDDSIAITIDKDILYGIVGNKFNFVKKSFFYTSQEEATKFFYKQLLMGDSVDNISGVPKIGEKRSLALLEGIETEEEMYQIVRRQYFQAGMTEEQLLLNGRLLKIRTKEGEIWSFPIA